MKYDREWKEIAHRLSTAETDADKWAAFGAALELATLEIMEEKRGDPGEVDPSPQPPKAPEHPA